MEEPEESATHKMLSSPVDSNQEDEEDMPGEAHPLVGKSPSAYSSNWTRRKKFIAVALCLVQFIVFGAFALIVPYFPNVVSILGLAMLHKSHASDVRNSSATTSVIRANQQLTPDCSRGLVF